MMIHAVLPIKKSCTYKTLILLILSCLLFVESRAQQKLYGNISIPSGSQVTLFGSQTFAGGTGVSAAIVRVGRTLPVGLLSFLQNTRISGAGAAGFVDGYVRKYGSSRFIFPVGHNGFYGPFAAAADKTYGAYFHSNPSSASFSISSKELAVAAVSGAEYWDINGANPTKITLTWTAESNIGSFANQLEKLIIVGWKDGNWVLIPSRTDFISILGGASSMLAGSITTIDPLIPNSYEVYSLGSTSASLPVTLTRFSAIGENNMALLEWTTIFESNSDHFDIERSKNGKLWEQVGTVQSFKESIVSRDYHFVDPKPLDGEILYRLKMVDADQTFSYSSIRSIYFGLFSNADYVYPNPASSILYLRQNAGVIDKAKITITDLHGRDLTGSVLRIENALDIHKLAAGTYVVSISDEKGSTITSKVVVQK